MALREGIGCAKIERNFHQVADGIRKEEGWNSLFWNNHDLPRIVSTWGGMMGLSCQICQGFSDSASLDEGNSLYLSRRRNRMTNYPFQSLEDVEDIESINYAMKP